MTARRAAGIDQYQWLLDAGGGGQFNLGRWRDPQFSFFHGVNNAIPLGSLSLLNMTIMTAGSHDRISLHP
jgi:hypothetical protein